MLRDMQVMISFNVNLVVPSGPSWARFYGAIQCINYQNLLHSDLFNGI